MDISWKTNGPGSNPKSSCFKSISLKVLQYLAKNDLK